MARLAPLLLILAASLAQAAPEIHVTTLYDYLEEQRSILNKTVHNLGGSTAFVRVELAEMFPEADGELREVALEGQDMAHRALIATPSRLIIPANGRQRVRLLWRGGREVERYFRVRLVPVLPEEGDETAVLDLDSHRKKRGR